MRRASIAIGATAILAICAFFLYAHLVKARTDYVLQIAYELSQKRPNTSIADLRQRFGSHLKQVEGCPPSECAYTVTVSNRVFAALRLAHYTEISSRFYAKDGVVLDNMVNYTTLLDHHHSIVTHVQIDLCRDCQMFAIHPWSESSALDTNGLVEIGSQTPEQTIRTVLLLNTACLTSLGGCKTIADLLPTVWRRTADGRIACRIANDKGFVEKPADWPWLSINAILLIEGVFAG
jgi:hypothetical protein